MKSQTIFLGKLAIIVANKMSQELKGKKPKSTCCISSSYGSGGT